MTAVISGTFDPITIGHVDIIMRAAALFGNAVVAVSDNTEKRNLLSAADRLESVKAVFADSGNIEVIRLNGLISECAASLGGVLVRGVRGSSDFDYEKQLFEINRKLSGVETVFIPANPEYAFISSTFVRDLIRYGKDYSAYVPAKALPFISK